MRQMSSSRRSGAIGFASGSTEPIAVAHQADDATGMHRTLMDTLIREI